MEDYPFIMKMKEIEYLINEGSLLVDPNNKNNVLLTKETDNVGEVWYSVPIVDLAGKFLENHALYNDFASRIKQSIKEKERIKEIAFKQSQAHDQSECVFLVSYDGTLVVNPWLDPTGSFKVEPFVYYGAKPFRNFCKEIAEKYFKEVIIHVGYSYCVASLYELVGINYHVEKKAVYKDQLYDIVRGDSYEDSHQFDEIMDSKNEFSKVELKIIESKSMKI